MSKFIIDKSYWNLFPNSKIGILLLKNLNTDKITSDEILTLLEESNKEAEKYLKEAVFSENPVIKIYRETFLKFKTKKGARSSIESLLKRVTSNPVKSISPLVDIYNSASLRYALPVGAEDIDTFVGDLRLTITKGNDEFYLIGDSQNSPTLENELCYLDDKGAVCRCFNWRDGQRTMITDKTKNAFLVIELLDINREKDLMEALLFIQENAKKHLNADVTKHILDLNNREIEL